MKIESCPTHDRILQALLMIEGDIEGGQPSMKSMIDIIIPTLVTAKLAALVGMGQLH